MVYRNEDTRAATFGWLCVETSYHCQSVILHSMQPPSGGCVLKRCFSGKSNIICCVKQPPSGGCVLKLLMSDAIIVAVGSHLRVAVC